MAKTSKQFVKHITSLIGGYMKEILTVNDLISELQKFNGNQRVVVSFEDEHCRKIKCIFEVPPYNFEEDVSEEELSKREKVVFIEAQQY